MTRYLLLVSVCVLLAPLCASAPISSPPPTGTKIEPARVNPPFWQQNVACNPDPALPHYTPYYNLTALTDPSLVYRLSEADVTGPMEDSVVNAFLSYWSNVNITTYRYGSGSVGVCLAGLNGTNAANNNPYCDFAVVTREIAPPSVSTKEQAWFEGKLGYDVFEVPIVTGSYNALGFSDAMVMFVNGNNPLRNITLAQLDAILSTTRNRGHPNPISTWDQLGVTDPAYVGQPINLYGSTVGNGFAVFLNRAVMLGGQWNFSIYNQSATVFPIGSLVTADPFGLGFSGISYLNQTGITVNVNVLNMAWDEKCAAVSLSQDTHCSREWPLSRFVYFYANKSPTQTSLDPVVYEYLNYLLSYEGQSIMRQAQGGVYFPLPLNILNQARAKYLVIDNPPAFVDNTGSVFFNQSSFCNVTSDALPNKHAVPLLQMWMISSAVVMAALSWMSGSAN